MARRHLNVSLFTSSRVLLILILVLSGLGLFFVLNASLYESYVTFNDPYFLFKQQAFHFLLGIGALAIGYLMPTKVWSTLSPWLYGLSILLLIAIFIPGIGRELNGAHRWISIAGFIFQPIEVVKFATVAFFAMWMSRHQRLVPFLALTAIPAGLVLLQPDLGSVLILLSIAGAQYYVAGGQFKHLLGVGTVGIVILAILVLAAPYRRERLLTYLNPESDPLGASFHIRQITLALGNGGVFGQGIGQSQQKYSYLPEPSTDSIFAVIAEEVGLVGSLLLIGLYIAFFATSLRVIITSELDKTAQLLSFGILTWLTAQTVLNLGAVVALVPLTGVPLPFFSYGGTALIMILFASGVLLHASRHGTVSRKSSTLQSAS